MKTGWKKAAIGAALLGCLVLMWQSLNGFGTCYPALSLRWRQPLEAAQVERLLRTEEEYGEEESAQCFMTLWREEQGTARTDTGEQAATAIRYRGDWGRIQRLTFLGGSEPGDLDKTGGMVSQGLAMSLWGSTDVVGQSFFWEGEKFQVSAVFKGKEQIVCLPQKTLTGFDCVELTGAVERNPVAVSMDFVAGAGLEPYDSAVYGLEMVGLLKLLSWLPLATSGIWGALWLVRLYPIENRWVRQGLLWGGVFLLAALLPLAIARLPGWLTPPQWSDFDFWLRLYESAGERVMEWLRISPRTKDVAAKGLLLRWLLGWTGSLFCLNWLCFRLGAENRKESPPVLHHSMDRKMDNGRSVFRN